MKHTLSLFALATLTACSVIPPQAHMSRGPEALLDASSELVNVTLYERGSVNQLADWINEDQPTAAEVHCIEGDPLCDQALDVMDQFGVPVTLMPSQENSIILLYERVVARDCENRYITNHANPYNLNHKNFGCSVSANTIQMVSNRQQFVNPELLDLPDGEKSVQIYKAYLTPVEAPELEDDYQFLVGEGQ